MPQPAAKPAQTGHGAFQALEEFWVGLPFWAPLAAASILYAIGSFGIPGVKLPEGLWGLAKLAAYAVALSGLFSWFTKFEHRGQVANKRKSLGPLTKLKWEQFEQLLADAYRRRGYEVDETAASAHGFVDFVLRKHGETIYVQAKHWKSRAVGVHLLRDLYRSMAGEAHRWVVVAMHGFTDEARVWAAGRHIQLVDGDDLLALLGNTVGAQAKNEAAPNVPVSAPLCAACGSTMVQHVNHHSGVSFWGCSNFPKCTGTRDSGEGAVLPLTGAVQVSGVRSPVPSLGGRDS
jgi:restriction system protein